MFPCKLIPIHLTNIALVMLPGLGLNTSSNAMVLNASIAVVYVLVGSFRGLLSFKGRAFRLACCVRRYSIVS